jgi:hypothetical protein
MDLFAKPKAAGMIGRRVVRGRPRFLDFSEAVEGGDFDLRRLSKRLEVTARLSIVRSAEYTAWRM